MDSEDKNVLFSIITFIVIYFSLTFLSMLVSRRFFAND